LTNAALVVSKLRVDRQDATLAAEYISAT